MVAQESSIRVPTAGGGVRAEIRRLERALALAIERRRNEGSWDAAVDTERLIQRLEDIEGPHVGEPRVAAPPVDWEAHAQMRELAVRESCMIVLSRLSAHQYICHAFRAHDSQCGTTQMALGESRGQTALEAIQGLARWLREAGHDV